MYSSFVQCQIYSCCNYKNIILWSFFSISKLYQWDWKEMWSIWSILKLYQQEWNTVILPILNWSLPDRVVFESETEMCSFVFSILKLYEWSWNRKCDLFFIFKLDELEWNRVKSLFTIPNFYNSLIPTRSCIWYAKVKKRCDLFLPF
jgi:hypothetical protein